jgi:hypothetical protein
MIMKFLALLFFAFMPYLLWAQTTLTKNDAGQSGGNSGFFETSNPVNFPIGASGWWHLLDVRHSDVNYNFAMQFAGSFFDQGLWFRKTHNQANTEWSRVLTETNGNLNGSLNYATPYGQNFFTGHQTGSTFSYPGGIFKAITDNPNGQSNVFYEGVTAGITNFTVRADGQAYFAGALGIGTPSPGSKLTVAGGDIKAYNYDGNSGISIGAENFQRPRIGFHASDNSRRFKIEVNNVNDVYERLGFFSMGSGETPEKEIFTIGKTGNIGIGEIVPRAALHVKSNGASINGSNQVNGNGLIVEATTGARSTSSGAQIEFVIPANAAGDNPWGQGRIITVAGNANNLNASGKMILGTRRMFDKVNLGQQWYYGDDIVIDELGNIGIGTLTPKEKLSVFGTVRAKEVKVESIGWPDYVFAKDYKIGTLNELEAYIKVNKHLPEMPSAAVIEKEGLALGEMNKKLLKNLEELTLHLIEQNKQLMEQSKQLTEQNKKIDGQNVRIAELEKKMVAKP